MCWSYGSFVNVIHRAQRNDTTMSEMEPAESFSMVLRNYQKQALRFVVSQQRQTRQLTPVRWMYSLETGQSDARDASSMHPLWCQ